MVVFTEWIELYSAPHVSSIVYHAELFKHVFDDLGAKWTDFHITENTVTFNVDI